MGNQLEGFKGELLSADQVLHNMIHSRQTYDLQGKQAKVTATITEPEARFIRELIESQKLCACLETGVAYGASTVAICQALDSLTRDGRACKHYGVDPCQFSEFKGAAVAALRRCGLENLFELLEGPSHLMLPKLIERNVKVDFVFVDGWHTFDYTMLDVFLGDKLLNTGGFMLLHDMPMPSKQKVAGYLRTHRKYTVLTGPPKADMSKRVLSFGKQLLMGRPRHALSCLWVNNLFVARKEKDYEPPYDFFKNF